MDTFEALKIIVQYANKRRLKNIDILANEDSESIHTQFYKKLLDGSIRTEDEAIAFIATDNSKSEAHYRKVKAQFKSKLFNNLIFLDSSNEDFSNLQSAHIKIVNEYCAILQIFSRGMNHAAVPFAENLFKEAKWFEFTSIAFDLADKIAGFYASRLDKKNYSYFKSEADYQKNSLDLECRLGTFYHQLEFDLDDKSISKTNLSKKVIDFYDSIENELPKYPAFALQLRARVISMMRFTITNNYVSAEKIIDDAIDFFEAKPFECTHATLIFCNQKLLCCIQLKKIDIAQKLFIKIIESERIKNSTWFNNLKYMAQIYLHARQYNEAYDHFKIAVTDSNLKHQPNEITDFYKLLELYFIVLNKLKVFDFPIGAKKSTSASKLINDFGSVIHEKEGLNIAVLVADAVLKLIDKRGLDTLVETLENYRKRYAKKSGVTLRSSIFLKMLSILATYPKSFKKGFEQSLKTFQELKTTEMNTFEQGYDIEVVPYEYLWEALETLFESEEIEYLNNSDFSKL